MLTRELVRAAVEAGKKSECLDGRDYVRLIDWFEPKEWEKFGFKPNETASDHVPRPWTREEFISQMREDVDFGFEKALNRRGISSGLMFNVVKLWLWILEDKETLYQSSYPMYGLPLFKAVAIKYGFPNPIGDDSGSEDKYNDHARDY